MRGLGSSPSSRSDSAGQRWPFTAFHHFSPSQQAESWLKASEAFLVSTGAEREKKQRGNGGINVEGEGPWGGRLLSSHRQTTSSSLKKKEKRMSEPFYCVFWMRFCWGCFSDMICTKSPKTQSTCFHIFFPLAELHFYFLDLKINSVWIHVPSISLVFLWTSFRNSKPLLDHIPSLHHSCFIPHTGWNKQNKTKKKAK